MSKLRFKISMSLDGFVAGPNQSVKDPLGVGGMRLHDWVFPLAAWRAPHGREGGEVNASTPIVEEVVANIGATVMGRKMFGGGPGPWGENPWDGWWGDDPPYHAPTYVLTHHAHDPIEMEGGTTFHFVTEGIESAYEQAKTVAGGQNISIAGGVLTPGRHLPLVVEPSRLTEPHFGRRHGRLGFRGLRKIDRDGSGAANDRAF